MFLLQVLNLILIFKGSSGFSEKMTFTSKCTCDSNGSIILIMYVMKS